MSYGTVRGAAVEAGLSADSLTADQTAQIQKWLGRAELLIVARITDLDAQIAAGTISATAVAEIEESAVARKLSNPRGLRSTTRSIDDGSIQETVDATRSDGVLRILPDEWALLLPALGGSGFTITASTSDAVANTWPWDM